MPVHSPGGPAEAAGGLFRRPAALLRSQGPLRAAGGWRPGSVSAQRCASPTSGADNLGRNAAREGEENGLRDGHGSWLSAASIRRPGPGLDAAHLKSRSLAPTNPHGRVRRAFRGARSAGTGGKARPAGWTLCLMGRPPSSTCSRDPVGQTKLTASRGRSISGTRGTPLFMAHYGIHHTLSTLEMRSARRG